MQRKAMVAAFLLLFTQSAHARAEKTQRWELGLQGKTEINPFQYRPAFGLEVSAFCAFHGFYSIGLLYRNIWILPSDNSNEFDSNRMDIMFLNRFRAVKIKSFELSIELGTGMTRYSGKVDIPETEGCMGCGKYGGTTYQPSFELGALFVFVLHKHVIFDMGLHMITSIGLQETDKHAFRPAPLAIHVDTGLLFRW